MHGRSRAHEVIALVVCVGIPLAFGGRFTMYASSVTYRLEVRQTMTDGTTRDVALSDLAGRVSHSAAPFIAGSEGFRTAAQIDALRAHLDDVGRAACDDKTTSIEVVLVEAPSTTSRATVRCAK